MFTLELPQPVSELVAGTIFHSIAPNGTSLLYMRAKLRENAYAVSLGSPGIGDFSAFAGELIDLDDHPNLLGVCVPNATINYDPALMTGQSGQRILDRSDWCVANREGVWLRAGNYWLDTGSGAISGDRPASPWVSVNLAAVRINGGETLLALSPDA
ncbi:hypothetical protein ACFFF7_12670 [Novosphingobium aquiterrae]|uniref:Uncharacterized protein n=1 Tax=Novosphingobium aquiterrae TaxID=624388 RepID=A0ABV6PKB4_9SPHN